jgi:hypothetical protein
MPSFFLSYQLDRLQTRLRHDLFTYAWKRNITRQQVTGFGGDQQNFPQPWGSLASRCGLE